MFRKSTRILTPAIVALTVCATIGSTQVFAKGGMGGPKGKPGMGREHRDHFRRDFRRDFRYNRSWDRFGFGYFGYPCFGCVEAPAPVCSCEVAVPEVVVKPVEVVVKPVVAEVPVCTTCEPSVGVSGPDYGYGWGYRHDRRDFRHRERPLGKGGRMGGGKK